jgi:hypothetical protein
MKVRSRATGRRRMALLKSKADEISLHSSLEIPASSVFLWAKYVRNPPSQFHDFIGGADR